MCICISVYLYICIYVSMYLCIYVYMYVYIYICVYVYMYTRRPMGAKAPIGLEIVATSTIDQLAGTWNLELGTWNLKPGTWNLEPRTSNLEPGTRHLALGTCNLGPRRGGFAPPPRGNANTRKISIPAAGKQNYA